MEQEKSGLIESLFSINGKIFIVNEWDEDNKVGNRGNIRK